MFIIPILYGQLNLRVTQFAGGPFGFLGPKLRLTKHIGKSNPAHHRNSD